MNYRPDIDGLRAIAVLAVIFYHLDFTSISGGFVGVDIFFVISGFLITKIIYAEIQAGCFSISEFYIRRIRRIFPALFFIVLITAIFSIFLISDPQRIEFSKSVISMALFVSNLFFWMHDDYFSVASELKPLLHTWTLSVEEQFYIVFPLLLVITRFFSRAKLATWLIILLLMSLSISIYLSGRFPSANFYLAPTRAWEFLSGSLLAIGILPETKPLWLKNIAALLGLFLIIASSLLLDDHSVFPGINAIYPTLGTCLIIYANSVKQTSVSVFLSNRPIRYIGLISYSLYLWHWPVIALLKNNLTGELQNWHQWLILLLVFVLSVLSYHFIERPFRKNTYLRKRVNLKTGLVAVIAMILLGYALYLYSTVTAAKNMTAETANLNHQSLTKGCFVKPESARSIERCSFGKLDSDKVFLLWGDSHALAMLPAFEQVAENQGWRGINASVIGCPPLFDVFINDADSASKCDGRITNNIKKFLSINKVDAVFMVSRWTLYEKGWIRNGRLMKPNSFISDRQEMGIDAQASSRVLARAIERTARYLTDKIAVPTVILAPVPVLPRLIDKLEDKRGISRADYIQQRQFVDKLFDQVSQYELLTIIDPIDILCAEDNCSVYAQDTPLYLDDNHLSAAGALLLYPIIQASGVF